MNICTCIQLFNANVDCLEDDHFHSLSEIHKPQQKTKTTYQHLRYELKWGEVRPYHQRIASVYLEPFLRFIKDRNSEYITWHNSQECLEKYIRRFIWRCQFKLCTKMPRGFIGVSFITVIGYRYRKLQNSSLQPC
jgi:hypothetical protein